MNSQHIQSGSHSITGSYREHNEDRIYVNDSMGLFLVADGMGGQQAGEKASQMAVEIIPEQLEIRLRSNLSSEKAVAEAIRQSVLEANRQIMDLAAQRPEYQSMGTTVVLVLIQANAAYAAGIGDSRAYLARVDRLDQLTTDHSLAQALVEAGTISPKEAREHRFRNILWKYLGSKEVGIGPDVKIIDTQPGDRLMLASDGVTGAVQNEDILRALFSDIDPQQAAESLVDLAVRNDSRDNLSCITVYLG